MTKMTEQEREGIRQAVEIYNQCGGVERFADVSSFLSRVGAEITPARLRSILRHDGEAFAALVGFSTVSYEKGEYRSGGGGAFGRYYSGRRPVTIPPRLKFGKKVN